MKKLRTKRSCVQRPKVVLPVHGRRRRLAKVDSYVSKKATNTRALNKKELSKHSEVTAPSKQSRAFRIQRHKFQKELSKNSEITAPSKRSRAFRIEKHKFQKELSKNSEITAPSKRSRAFRIEKRKLSNDSEVTVPSKLSRAFRIERPKLSKHSEITAPSKRSRALKTVRFTLSNDSEVTVPSKLSRAFRIERHKLSKHPAVTVPTKQSRALRTVRHKLSNYSELTVPSKLSRAFRIERHKAKCYRLAAKARINEMYTLVTKACQDFVISRRLFQRKIKDLVGIKNPRLVNIDLDLLPESGSPKERLVVETCVLAQNYARSNRRRQLRVTAQDIMQAIDNLHQHKRNTLDPQKA